MFYDDPLKNQPEKGKKLLCQTKPAVISSRKEKTKRKKKSKVIITQYAYITNKK